MRRLLTVSVLCAVVAAAVACLGGCAKGKGSEGSVGAPADAAAKVGNKDTAKAE